ncbi:Hypothetical protein P9303_19821 [Prochlorococcus marinus str. MIT 9303]|uniref:Uncharacterized protein n=1 Tax=Prochlorococcus marinus (strain MIT 9303) TaxID=59922 RepID=A2CB64_PROM3|nr:Hypothetical protein P9303_19821 [Prochlorococcus marinus str. MIT 9303]
MGFLIAWPSQRHRSLGNHAEIGRVEAMPTQVMTFICFDQAVFNSGSVFPSHLTPTQHALVII